VVDILLHASNEYAGNAQDSDSSLGHEEVEPAGGDEPDQELQDVPGSPCWGGTEGTNSSIDSSIHSSSDSSSSDSSSSSSSSGSSSYCCCSARSSSHNSGPSRTTPINNGTNGNIETI
jgi:hypothetical protein